MKDNDLNKNHRARVMKRFDETGINGFSDHEILELILFYSITRRDTKPIAKLLLKEFGSIESVFAAEKEQLEKIDGIGPASSRLLKLIKRVGELSLKNKAYNSDAVISSASALIDYLGGTMANLPEEQFRVVFVNHRNKVVKDEVLSYGVEDQTAVYPKKVAKRALSMHATGVIVAHNHPSGKTSPSSADKHITKAIAAAMEVVEIRLLDHIILGREGKGYFSFRENGLL